MGAAAKGSNVVTLDIEHPSTAYPWLRVARETGAEARLVRVWDDPAGLRSSASPSRRRDTSVIAVSYVQYSTGYRFVLRELAELAHAHGALWRWMRRRRRAWRRSTLRATTSTSSSPAATSGSAARSGQRSAGSGPSSASGSTRRSSAGGARSTRTPSTRARCRSRQTARSMEYSTMGYGSAVALGGSLRYVLDLGVDRVLAHDLASLRASPTGWSRSGQRY